MGLVLVAGLAGTASASAPTIDAGFGKIKDRGIAYYARPDKSGPGEINRYWGGRGVYFEDPAGHLLELITKPYGDLADLR